MIINHISREVGARRWSIRDLARESGLSYQTAFVLYHGRVKRLDLDTLDRLCRALGCAVSDLFEHVPEELGREGNRGE